MRWVCGLCGFLASSCSPLQHQPVHARKRQVSEVKCGQAALVYRSSSSSRVLLYEIVQPLHVEWPAVERPGVTERDKEGSSVPSIATFAELKLSFENFRPLVTVAEATRAGSVRSSSVQKRKPRSSMV